MAPATASQVAMVDHRRGRRDQIGMDTAFAEAAASTYSHPSGRESATNANTAADPHARRPVAPRRSSAMRSPVPATSSAAKRAFSSPDAAQSAKVVLAPAA